MNSSPTIKDDNKTERITTRSEITYITRRLSLRIPFKMRIKYGLIRNNIYLEHSEPRLGGFVVNLSQNGIGIEGLKGLPPESRIRANLFTGEKTLKFEGRVKWSDINSKDKCKMGIEFTGRSDKIMEMYTRTLFKNRFGL
jgi:PilZ domain